MPSRTTRSRSQPHRRRASTGSSKYQHQIHQQHHQQHHQQQQEQFHRRSPTSVRDVRSCSQHNPSHNPLHSHSRKRSATFDEAFRSGTVLPYVLDSAVRSLDLNFLNFHTALCSSFGANATATATATEEMERWTKDCRYGTVAQHEFELGHEYQHEHQEDEEDEQHLEQEQQHPPLPCREPLHLISCHCDDNHNHNCENASVNANMPCRACGSHTESERKSRGLHPSRCQNTPNPKSNSNSNSNLNLNTKPNANPTPTPNDRKRSWITVPRHKPPGQQQQQPYASPRCSFPTRKTTPPPTHARLPLGHYSYEYEANWMGYRPLAPWIMSMNDDSSSGMSSPQSSSKSGRSSGSSSKGAPSASSSKQAADASSGSSSAVVSSKRGSSTPKSSSSAASSSMAHGNSTDELEQVHVQHPGADRSALKELPALRDAPPAKREELFVLKLKLCSVIFSFDDPMADKRGKDMKRQTLLELVDYVNTPAGQKIFTESVMGDLMAMVSANVCRALPPATDDFDPEEDEPVLEPAWPHLQVAYEFFLRFIVSSEVNAKAAKKYVDQKFCLQLVELFDSEDPRERDYLKTILHRIYGKFMSHRSFIRRAISNVFYRFVYETERHNGIGELLEILGSIINGFAIPLKKEHLQFLVRALIPLHKPKCVALYHQQLSYCIIQYVEKDADTATPILNGFFKCWPWSSSGKQVMFLNELEEILELLGAEQLAQVSDMLFTNLARCLDSDHFQVVERALFLWNNEHLVNSGCLSRLNAQAVLPIIYGPLYKNSAGHWNATVEGLAQNVLKMYMEYDLNLYDRCTANYFREEEEAKRKLATLEERWTAIEKVASTNTPSISVR